MRCADRELVGSLDRFAKTTGSRNSVDSILTHYTPVREVSFWWGASYAFTAYLLPWSLSSLEIVSSLESVRHFWERVHCIGLPVNDIMQTYVLCTLLFLRTFCCLQIYMYQSQKDLWVLSISVLKGASTNRKLCVFIMFVVPGLLSCRY